RAAGESTWTTTRSLARSPGAKCTCDSLTAKRLRPLTLGAREILDDALLDHGGQQLPRPVEEVPGAEAARLRRHRRGRGVQHPFVEMHRPVQPHRVVHRDGKDTVIA